MTFSPQDLLLIGFLAFLEGILSIDNALVLAMIARRLPKDQQKKALTYGLFGAVFFRLTALAIATRLMEWNWVKFVGGGYLVFLAVKHFLKPEPPENPLESKPRSFWGAVIAIELMDIAFAVDSILAAIALTNKLWLVFTGGMLGVLLMRVAASQFIRLLHRFPNFETTAYLLVFIIGVKVILEGLHLPQLDFHSATHPSFWVFWGIMLSCLAYGFMRRSD